MSELIDKAVWLEDMTRVTDVVELLERTYTSNAWTGGMLFQDVAAGFLLVACFDPGLYPGDLPTWESLFPARDLRALTLEQVLADGRRFRPWLAGDVALMLRGLKLLPV